MHYRNGREAKNGDKVVSLGFNGGQIEAFGMLSEAVPGNDFCNGYILPMSKLGACLCDCLHADDLAELIKKAGLDTRPTRKDA